MSTLKSGRYPKMIGGKKKKLINIMEELLGIDHLTIGTVEQLEDRKKALLLAEEHKRGRIAKRAEWEDEKLQRKKKEQETLVRKTEEYNKDNGPNLTTEEYKEKMKTDAAATAVAEKEEKEAADAAATTEKNAKKDAIKKGRRVKDYGFTFVGDIETNEQTDIKNIINQLNDILRLKEIGLYEDIQTEPNTVLIKTINIKDGETQISETPEKIFVAPLEEEISDTKKD